MRAYDCDCINNLEYDRRERKAQLSSEGKTSDLISKTETAEHLRRMLESTVLNTDYDEGFVDGVEFGVSTVSTMPTIQPEPCGDKSYTLWKESYEELKRRMDELTSCSDLISRQAVLDAIVQCTNCGDEDTLREYVLKHSLDNGWTGGILEALDAVKDLPTVQPELTDEQAIAHLQSSGWMQRHDKEMYESGLREQLADDSNSYDSLLPPAQPEPQWIPVSERLPETEEFVLASLSGKYRNITFEHACEIADYADGEWCIYAYPHMSAEKCAELIEAWMPLPEAYKPNK